MSSDFAAQSAAYYERKLAEFGATARGVDWNSRESQYLRFAQLLRVAEGQPIAVNDYGCGYGALATYLREHGDDFEYCGYDAAPGMIAAAQQIAAGDPRCTFTASRAALAPRAFTVASGVFNVKQQAADERWWQYVADTLDDMASVSRQGFAANFLTSYSDADRKRPDLFYPDPSDVLRHCLTRYSRRAAVLHDYPLYEFTVLVRF